MLQNTFTKLWFNTNSIFIWESESCLFISCLIQQVLRRWRVIGTSELHSDFFLQPVTVGSIFSLLMLEAWSYFDFYQNIYLAVSAVESDQYCNFGADMTPILGSKYILYIPYSYIDRICAQWSKWHQGTVNLTGNLKI